MFGVDAGVIIFKQLRAEVNFPRLLGLRIQGEHPHAAAKPHPHVEELNVQLALFNIIPQRMRSIVLNAVVGLGGQVCQGWRQIARRAAPGLTRKIVGHRLEYGVIKATGLTVGNS